jgi:hypothetical protein
MASGRFHRAVDLFERGQSWPALYLGLTPECALGEIVRHVTPVSLHRLNGFLLSELSVELAAVFDCRNPRAVGLDENAILADYEWNASQSLADAAIGLGAEAILVPSATRLGANLVVFSAQLRPTSALTIRGHRSPRLQIVR